MCIRRHGLKVLTLLRIGQTDGQMWSFALLIQYFVLHLPNICSAGCGCFTYLYDLNKIFVLDYACYHVLLIELSR